MALSKEKRRYRIKKRIRKIISGTPERPRMSIFRSNKEIYVQIIDDINSKTLGCASSLNSIIKDKKVTKIEKAGEVGKLISEKAKEINISSVVLDRNGYLYHGRVKALAESARKNGLKF